MEKNKKRRAVELAKDVLIVLLTVSAFWLAAQTQLLTPLRGMLREEGTQTAPGQNQGSSRAEAVLPVAMVANLPGGIDLPSGVSLPEGTEGVRYGIRYDQTACQALFQQVAGTLVEALSDAQSPAAIDRGQWETALVSRPGVYLEFPGDLPMSVLTGWLSGEGSQLRATVRRMALTVEEEGVAVYYRDEDSGGYYRCRSEMADPASLAGALSGLADNGAFYAFESELYDSVDPDTLFCPEAPAPAVYTAADPVSGGQSDLARLMEDLGFSPNSTSFYATDEQVARSGNETVRLSDRGVALYEAGEGGESSFAVLNQGAAGPLFDVVETCRQVAARALSARSGEGRLYLMSVRESRTGWEVEFGYSLNGIPVQMEEGYAARFLVEGNSIVQFTMYFRSYTPTGTASPVLPPRQAAAALAAQGLTGGELLLTYSDSGGDTVTAGWAARDNSTGEA